MAKFYVLNTVARSKKAGYGTFTVAGRPVMPSARFPLEESQLEAEYDHIRKLWRDGVIEVRESLTGGVYTFPRKAEGVEEAKASVPDESSVQVLEMSDDAPDSTPVDEPDDLADVLPLPVRTPPKSMELPPDSMADSPIQDLLEMAKEEEEPNHLSKSEKGKNKGKGKGRKG